MVARLDLIYGMAERKRILIADDNETARALIRNLLAEIEEWTVCAEAANGAEAIESARKSCPDLAILDIQMPRVNGIQAAKEILRYCPNAIVLTDSLHDVNLFVPLLKDIGVRAFIPKTSIGTDLIPTVEAVLSGKTTFLPSVRTF